MYIYLQRRTTTPRVSAVRARQSGMVDIEDEEVDELQTLEDAIENINIEQFHSPTLSSTRLDNLVGNHLNFFFSRNAFSLLFSGLP